MEEEIDLAADKDDSDEDIGLADLTDLSDLESNVSIESIKGNADLISFE